MLAIDKQSKRGYNVFRNTNGGDRVQDLVFDYSKLRGRIREICKTQENYAEKLGIGYVSLSKRLNNQLEFSSSEIYNSCDVLEIPVNQIPDYFFTLEVQKHEQAG